MSASRNTFADLIPKAQDSSSPTSSTGLSPFMAGLEAFNLGAEKLPHGILQLLFESSYAPDALKRGSQEVARSREETLGAIKSERPVLGLLSELAGGITSAAPLMAIPGVGEAGGLMEAGTAGLGQGLATGAGQYVNPGESRLANTAIGGLLGGPAGLLFRGLGLLGNKAYNAVKGAFSDPGQQAVYELAKQHNVPISAPDIMQNPIVKTFGEFVDKIPFIGTRGFRKEQMEGARTAAEEVTDKYKDIMTGTDFGGKTGIKRIQEIADSGQGNRANQARALLDDINNSGHDWNQIMQTSGNMKLFRAKLIADRKYDRVAEIADQFGAVDTSGIENTISKMIAQENESVIKNRGVIGLLDEMKQGVREKPLNFTQLRQFRSDLSGQISDYFTGANAAIGKKGVGVLQAVKDQIDRSLNKFSVSNGGALKTAWQNADNFYRYSVAPAKDVKLAQALKNADADTIYSKFITTGTREGGKGTGSAQRFYNALDNKGRAAVRYGMVSDAFEHALKDDGQFSPAQFAGYLDRYTAARDVVFSAGDKAELDGFSSLMRHVQRSFQELNLPDTGVKSIPYIIAGAAIATPLMTMLKAGGMTYAIKKLFTTDAGKRFLLASSKLKDRSPAMQNAVNVFSRMLQEGVEQAGLGMTAENAAIQDTGAGLGRQSDSSSPFADLIPAGA